MKLWTPAHGILARQRGGLLPRTTQVGGWRFRHRGQEYSVPVWDGSNVESCPIVPRAERVTQPSLRSLEWQEIDQGQTSACAVASFCNALQFLIAKLGRAKTTLDWSKAYISLSGGYGGVEIGAVLSYAMSHGIPTKDGGVVVVTEAWDAASREAIVSGLQRGCVATFGHDVHAECAASEIVSSDGSEWLDVRNSWGKSWGENGWHKFPLDDVEMAYGAALIRDLEIRPADVQGMGDASV